MELNISVKGHTTVDLEIAMAEVMRKLSEGYLIGSDSNSTGNYNFTVTGTSIEYYVLDTDMESVEPEKYTDYEDAHEAAMNTECEYIIGLDENGTEVNRFYVD